MSKVGKAWVVFEPPLGPCNSAVNTKAGKAPLEAGTYSIYLLSAS